ncbi:MAG: hypothetical protein ACJ76Y_27510 [Thermoanaerobaculia bacterium]
MRIIPVAFLVLGTAALHAPAFGRDNCPSYRGFRELTIADVKQCTGETFRQSTGRQEVPKLGYSIGDDNPKCGSKIKDVIFGVGWDGSGLPLPSIPYERGEYDKVKCKRAVVKLPPNTTICGIRYWASAAKKKFNSKRLTERSKIRNTGRGESHRFARKCPTLIQVNPSGTEIVVVFKNWRESFPRYFQFEIEYQLAPSTKGNK